MAYLAVHYPISFYDIQDVNEQRHVQLESEDSTSQNRQMIVSGDQSSGSSISAKNIQSENTTLTVDTTQVYHELMVLKAFRIGKYNLSKFQEYIKQMFCYLD